MTKLWAGRFCTSTNEKVERFQASIFFDRRLYEEDILGSAIHAKMLHLIGILDKEEIKSVLGGLKEVLHKFHTAEVSVKYADEDIHMLVENLLREEIGPLAGKLHTGRSRNDQVALDMHLYFRKSSLTAIYLILTLVETLAELSKTNIDVTLPGYTHLQRAQPVLLSHHLLAYGWMFLRDAKRFFDTYHACNISPLGSGAIAGSTFPLDREYVRQQLKFSSFYPNSMDAVSNRDYLLDYLNSASTCMMHLSRLSEEIVLWASAEFRFIELSDNFCTGSSMMPQKKNPDVPELIRGKSGRVYGSLFGLYTLLKGLPLTYNKDMQEDKEGAFDAEYTLTNSLSLMEGLLKEAKFLEVSMKYATENDFSNATDLADYLVQKGVPFREAHEIVGKLVRECIDKGVFLLNLPFTQYVKASSHFAEDIYQFLQINNVVSRRVTAGGTAKPRVEEQLHLFQQRVSELKGKLIECYDEIKIEVDEAFQI